MAEKAGIRVGVIGCGVIAQVMHLPYLVEIPDFHIAALCDVSRTQVEAVGERYHVPAARRFTDYQELIACSDVDSVLVLSSGSHAPAAIAAAQARKHVFVEKPMCFTLREAEEMIVAANASNVVLMVGYMKAYDPTYATARRLWQQMWADGEVRLIRVHDICHNNARVVADLYGSGIVLNSGEDIPAEARAQVAATTRALTDEALGPDAPAHARTAYHKFLGLLTHDTSILMLAFGPPQRVVSAEIWDEGLGLVAVLEYGNNVRCVIETARGDQQWMDESLAVYGVRRHAILEFPSPYHKNAATVLRVTENVGTGYVERREVSSLAEAFKRELEHFRDCLRTGDKPLTDGSEGMRNVALAQEVIRRALASE